MVKASELKLYCSSLVNYKDSTITHQTVHILAKNQEEAYNKSCKVFELIQKDPDVKSFISCIELSEIDGHKICIA